jgi:Tfp pilus assembly protein PilV
MTARARSQVGVALVEILVALFLFALIATPTARTVTIAQRSRVSSGRWMRAAELAGELVERLRAGAIFADSEDIDGFTRTWTLHRDAFGGVDRCDVTIRWNDQSEHELVLSTLLPSRP